MAAHPLKQKKKKRTGACANSEFFSGGGCEGYSSSVFSLGLSGPPLPPPPPLHRSAHGGGGVDW